MRNILFILIILLFTSCNSMENHKKAQKDSDYIIENLTNYELIKAKLPEKYFQPAKTEEFINSIKDKCDWKNRKGKFVDYFTMGNIGGSDQTAFIYEYFLNCDSLRVILIYNMTNDSPELFNIKLEQIETKSDMIIDPSKQLIPQ